MSRSVFVVRTRPLLHQNQIEMSSDDYALVNLLFIFMICVTSGSQILYPVNSTSSSESAYEVNRTANESSASHNAMNATNVSGKLVHTTSSSISGLGKLSTAIFMSATTMMTTTNIVPDTMVTAMTYNVSTKPKYSSAITITTAVSAKHTTSGLIYYSSTESHLNSTKPNEAATSTTTPAVRDHLYDVTLPTTTPPQPVQQPRPSPTLILSTPAAANRNSARVRTVSTYRRRVPTVTVLPTYRRVSGNGKRVQVGYDAVATSRGNGFNNERFRVLPFPVGETSSSPLRATQSDLIIRVGRKRLRQPVPWKPLPWRKAHPQTPNGKSLRRQEIINRWQQNIHQLLFTMATTTSTTTEAATSTALTGNETITASDVTETYDKHKQQLIYGAVVVCSLVVGGALIALIGVSAARCRDALLRRRRSNSDDEHDDVIPEIDESHTTTSVTETRNAITWFCFRRNLVDCLNCFRLTLSRRLMNDQCDTPPPPDEERKRGDGVESRPEVVDAQSRNNVHINRSSDKGATLKHRPGTDDQHLSVRDMIESFNRKFRPASASSGRCSRPSNYYHARIYMSKRCQQMQSAYQGASRVGMTSSLASLPLPSSTNVLKEIAVKDCRNSIVSRSTATSATASTQKTTTSSATNCRTADITTPIQRHSLDGDTNSGVSQPVQSSGAQENVSVAHGMSSDNYNTHPESLVVLDRFEPVSAAPDSDFLPANQFVSNATCDTYLVDRAPTGVATSVDVDVVKCLNEPDQRVMTSDDVNADNTPQLNDVIRQSEILKSFRRVAPPRNSNADRRSRFINYSLGGSTAVSLASTEEIDEPEHSLTNV